MRRRKRSYTPSKQKYFQAIFSVLGSRNIFPLICLFVLLMAVTGDLQAGLSSQYGEQIMDIITKMETAYAKVEEYQAELKVSEYRDGQITEMKRFRYTFKKPYHLRIDMESPHPGTVLVYPDKNGKVTVKPGGWAGFLELHLSLDSVFFRNIVGQRMDQTDLGLLVRNIAHSLTDQRRGTIKISEQDCCLLIEVLAEDHYLFGVLTLYLFSIDKTRWLPVAVEEFTPDGIIKRKGIILDLRTPIALPDNFFRIEKGESGHGRPGK